MTLPDSTKQVRVLHLCAVDFTVRQFIAPLALTLSAAGYRVECACTPGPHWEELKAMGVTMVPLPLARSANPIRAIGSVSKLVGELRRRKVQVLHVHTPVASLVGRLAGFLAGTPLIIYTAHGFYFHDRMPSQKRRVHIALEWLFGRLNHALFCVSQEDATEAVRLGIGKVNSTWFVSNGVDPVRFDPARFSVENRNQMRTEFGIPEDAFVVMLMGRLVREKGYLEFFASLRGIIGKHANLHALIVGDTVTSEHDDAKAEIVRAAEAAELRGRVHFAGMRSDIPELLHASDLFVLPSWREGMPVSILEAMMMGLPVIATNIRGCREEVVDGATGYLIEPRSENQLGDVMDYLVSHPLIAKKLGDTGRMRALENFRADHLYARQVELYSQLVKEHLR